MAVGAMVVIVMVMMVVGVRMMVVMMMGVGSGVLQGAETFVEKRRADEDDGLAFVVGGDLSSNFAGAIGDLLFGEENLHLCGGGEDGRA